MTVLPGMRHKVLAYITREQAGVRQVLVFDHQDQPEAGLQVPAGTVEPGELIEPALWREIEEEAGLRPSVLRLVRKLAEHPEPAWGNIRHVFHLEALTRLPETWIQTVGGTGEDRGYQFVYHWAGLDVILSGGQHRWLARLREGAHEKP